MGDGPVDVVEGAVESWMVENRDCLVGLVEVSIRYGPREGCE